MTSLHRRLTILVLGLVTLGYLLSMVVVTGKDLGVPPQVYNAARDAYMRPHLMQSWGLFAKGIVNSDKTIVMRAQIQAADGSITTTEWTDLGVMELETIHHNPIPSRDGRTVFKMAGDLQVASRQVPRDIRPAIAEDIYQQRRLTLQDYLAAVADAPDLTSAQRRSTAAFVNLDNVTNGLTTLYAYRIWQRPVVAVQWYVLVSPVPRFGTRDTGEAPDPYTATASGWRTATIFDEAVIRAWM